MGRCQQRVLKDLSSHDYLLDNYWRPYNGHNLVILSVLRRGWAERPTWKPHEGLCITDAGRLALASAAGE